MPDQVLPQPQRPQQPPRPNPGSTGSVSNPSRAQAPGAPTQNPNFSQPRSSSSPVNTPRPSSSQVPTTTPNTSLPSPKPPVVRSQPVTQNREGRPPSAPVSATLPSQSSGPSAPSKPVSPPQSTQPPRSTPSTVPAPQSVPSQPSAAAPSRPAQPVSPQLTPSAKPPVFAAAPAPSSRLMQNLQSVSAKPFQDPQSSMAPAGASSAPSSTNSNPGVSVSQTGPTPVVPKETLSLDPLSTVAKPARVPATAAGADRVGGARKWLFGVVALVALFAIGLGAWFFFQSRQSSSGTAITPSLPGTSRQVSLTYWGLWESEEVMQPLINAYQQQNPGVSIKYVQQNSRQYRQRLQAAIRDGSGPDIFRYHNTWGPMLQSDLAPAPSSVLTASTVERDFYPVVTSDVVKGSQVLGMPLMYDGLALLYNKNMLEAANALPPTNWQQVRELAVKLTIKSGSRIERGGVALGTADNVDHFSDILAFMMLQNSADLTNPISSNAQSALEFYTIFSRVDQVWDDTLPPSTQAFASEQVAMIFAPSWRIHEIQKLNPNINIGVARLPQIDGTNIAWATYWVEGVSANSKQKEESWKFLNYLGQAEQLRKFHTSASSERTQGELYPRVDMASELKTDPLVTPYLDDALIAKSWYLASATYDEGLNDGLIQYYKDAVNAMNQGGSALKALQTVLPGIQQVLSRYGLGNVSAQQ